MGCLASTTRDAGGNGRRPGTVVEVAVFVPGLRIPKGVDLSQPLHNSLSRNLVERLSALRIRIVVMAAQEAPTVTKPSRKTATQHGGSSLADLLQALEDYLPVLLGLVKNGSQSKDKVQFVWVNQEDVAEETGMTNAWYEVLSVLHLMAMLCLSEANSLLLPKMSNDGHQLKASEEDKQTTIDIFLKAAGYLDCAIQHVLPQIPPETRKDLPLDLAEGVLRAFCMQALGQSVDIQLGIAIDSSKATLAVKRRLACEMVKCWHQVAFGALSDSGNPDYQIFLSELKIFKNLSPHHQAAAYYYHGLILDEGNTEESHGMAIAALQAAEEFLKESKRACEVFNAMPPTSRNPPLWGSARYHSEKIPKDASSKARINQDLYSNERLLKPSHLGGICRVLEPAPALPDFAVALKPDDYQLPPVDASWNEQNDHQ
ncbi:Vacuolar protein-sorting protein BRO1 [Cocos nucifera]|uniref:Vacuolar protein-sorting protein BRO1 n=1 Tax=Cocos nucifera TaxID=13894 RepID=A0A8K0IJW9_COCNU|nr:Vacuolar protein-sorting protein BRO1 [Cocos nucifera]